MIQSISFNHSSQILNKMKILIITDYAAINGGAEHGAQLLKNYYIDQGHECVVFTSSAKDKNKTTVSDFQTFGSMSRLRTYSQAYNPIAYWDLKKLFKKWQPDIVTLKLFLTQISPSILTLLKPYPCILYVEWYKEICLTGTKLLPNNQICHHNIGVVCLKNKCIPIHQAPFLYFQHYLFSKHKHHFQKIVACSDFVKSALEKSGLNNIETVYEGIPTIENKVLKLEKPSNKIIFIGRLVYEKGIHLLIPAFKIALAKFPELKLDIYGDGPELEKLQTLSSKLNIETKVNFKGYVPNDILEKSLTDVDLQVVSSVWNEPFGFTVIEAMRRGTPVIGTKMGAITELITHENNGLLAEPNKVSIAEQIIHFYSHPALKNTLIKNGFTSFQDKYTIKIMGDNMLNIFKQAIHNS